jgi:hypothetical protein
VVSVEGAGAEVASVDFVAALVVSADDDKYLAAECLQCLSVSQSNTGLVLGRISFA